MTEQENTLVNSKNSPGASLDTLDTVTLSTHSQESICYGDSIYLVVTGTENAQSIKAVSSFISSPLHQILTLDEFSYGENPNPAPDIHMAAFRVLGPNKSSAEEELSKFNAKGKLTNKEESELIQLKKEVENEEKENSSEQQSLLGKEVVYGNICQLQHHYTDKFIGVSDNQTAVVDRASLKVTLFETNGKNIQFKIIPKYRISNIGDKIRFEDQIVLENVKTHQYLQVSKTRLQDAFYGIQPNSHEINASAVDSPFSIYSHCKFRRQEEDDYLAMKNIRGGSVIRLYHLQQQCYVAASGSCAFEDEDLKNKVIIDDVHLRKRQTKSGELKPASTSAITYWEIELTSAPLSGDEIKRQDSFRLKHLLTQMYLSVIEDDSKLIVKLVKLEDDETRLNTSFAFRPSPIIEGAENIAYESHARIFHPKTNTWLKAEECQGKAFSIETNQSAFRWDNAACYQILAEHSKGFRDVFTLEEVDPKLLSYFHHVMGYLPIIINYLKTYDIEANPSTEMVTSLESLANWILEIPGDKDKAKERKKRQKLLRNLGVIKLLMEIQNRFKDIPPNLRNGPNYQIRKAATKKVYAVIEAYVKGQSRKNENYTYEFIPIFESHFDLDINAESILIELVRDNKVIIKQFSLDFEEKTKKLFYKLALTHNRHIFSYFSVMCVANKNPIQKNQEVLANHLLDQQFQNLIFHMELRSDNKVYAISPLNPAAGYKLLSKYDWEKENDFEYLLAQLDFFAKLCHGSNENAIEILKTQFPFEVLFNGLKDDKIHPQIRTKFALLIITMFIDVGANRAVLENFNLTFEYEDCIENPKDNAEMNDTAISGVQNEYFPQMKIWFLEFFDGLSIYRREDFKDTNNLTTVVLEMILLFTKFGYYTNQDDADLLLELLINILNGKKDMHSPKEGKTEDPKVHTHFEEEGRYENAPGNEPIFEIKIKTLHIFELFMNYRFLKRLQRLIFLYRDKKDTKTLNHYLEKLYNPKFNIHELLNLASEAMNHLSKGILNYAKYKFEDYEGEDKFESILLDLTQYDNLDVVTASLRLLNNQYMVENNLFEKAIQTQVLINKKSINFFNQTNEQLPQFRRLLKTTLTRSEVCNELNEILDSFIQACTLSNQNTEPHPQNQKILYNLGILADVLNLIERILAARDAVASSPTETFDCFSGPTELAKVSCRLLQKMAKDNIIVQQRLYNRLEILAEKSLFDAAPKELADLLTEMFTGAQDVVMNVKIDDIKLICSLMEQRETLQVQFIPSILGILKAITKVEEIDLPLHFNQVHVMNTFMSIKPERINEFLGTEVGKDEIRANLLKCEDSDDDGVELMLATFDLMASLCEGENLHHESICQSMISVDELLDILNRRELTFDRKFQFASFFNWVYLNTHKVLYGFDTTIDDNPKFWEFLENSSELLSSMLKYLETYSRDNANEIKKMIQQQSSLSSVMPKHRSKSSMIFIDFSDPALINYLMKGIFSIILVFYRRYFSTNPKESVSLKEYDPLLVSFEICRKLIELSIILQPLIEKQHQAKLMYDAVLSILTHPEIQSRPGQIDEHFDREKLIKFSKLVDEEENFVSQPARSYQEEYKDEIELNKQFNNYVKHLRRAYWGKNTVEVQIDGIGLGNFKYSEFVDELCDDSLPDSIPLGKSFQKHLALFFTHTKEGCEVKIKFARSIVRQLDYSYQKFNELSEREKLKQERLDIKSFQLLRGAIHNEIMYIDHLKNQNPIQFRTELEKVKKIQKEIQNLDDTCMKALTLMDHPCKSVAAQSLALLTDMLYGGNEYIQSQFKSLATISDEKYFNQMSDVLLHGSNTIRESRFLIDKLKKIEFHSSQMRENFKDICKYLNIHKPRPPIQVIRKEIDSGETSLAIENGGFELTPLYTHMEHVQGASSRILDHKTTEEPERVRIHKTRFQIIQEEEDKIKELQQESLHISRLKGAFFKNTLHDIQISFELMGLMCDGQQKFLQDFFREQADNPESIDMIAKTVEFLTVLYKDINKDSIVLVTEVFKVLTEFMGGNYKNQKSAFRSKIMDVINRIFETTTFKCCSFEEMIELYDSIIRMLQVISEETSLSTKDLVRDIINLLDVDSVHQIIGLLNDIISHAKMGKKISPKMDEGVIIKAEDVMFRYYHFLVHLNDFGSQEMIHQEQDNQKSVTEAWEYCESNSKSIEISYITEDNVHILNKVHFKSLKSRTITEEVRRKVKNGVNRDSAEDKLKDFLDWFEAVKVDQNYQNNLKNNPLMFYYLKCQKWRKYIFLLWSFIINLFILSTWVTPCSRVEAITGNDNSIVYDCVMDPPNSSVIPPILPVVPFWYSYAFFPLGIIHLLMALDLLVLFYIVNKANFVVPKILKKIKNINIKWEFKWIRKLAEGEEQVKKENKKGQTEHLKINIIGPQVFFIWMIFLSSLLSLPLRGYLYPISLLYIIERSGILRRVLLAVTKNGKSLIYVAIFGMIIIYIFSVIAFALFSQQAQSTVNPESDAYIFCHSLYECAVSIGRWGLLDTIGLFLPQASTEFSQEIIRIIFDVAFFIIITTIGLNIVFGIIVDTFAELREENFAKEEDMKNVCFICGIENHKFDLKGNGFKTHVREEHNMWDYYSFFLYLDTVDQSDHSATESFVFKNLKKDKTVFFPHNEARCLSPEDDVSVADTIEEQSKLLSQILAKISKLEKNKTS